MILWLTLHVPRLFLHWCNGKNCYINDYAHKDEFYPFMHDHWTINTSKVKNFLCEIGQRSKVGMTIFFGLVEHSEGLVELKSSTRLELSRIFSSNFELKTHLFMTIPKLILQNLVRIREEDWNKINMVP